jgi:hypothetical protein
MLELAKPIGAMIPPLALSPRVPMHGRFIYAGIADRLVHPRHEAAQLWEHWGRPEICWYPGHTGFFRSRPVQRFIDDALVKSGLVDPAPTRRNPDAAGFRRVGDLVPACADAVDQRKLS